MLWSTVYDLNFSRFETYASHQTSVVGIPIGSPLGSLICEISMDKFEKDPFSSLSSGLLGPIIYRHRYFDDVLCLWNGSQELAEEFLQFLDSVYPSIKFTMEYGDSKINVLHLSISVAEGRHKFRIHRKSNSTDVTIDGSSYYPMTHKLAVFHHLTHRLIHIPPLEENA